MLWHSSWQSTTTTTESFTNQELKKLWCHRHMIIVHTHTLAYSCGRHTCIHIYYIDYIEKKLITIDINASHYLRNGRQYLYQIRSVCKRYHCIMVSNQLVGQINIIDIPVLSTQVRAVELDPECGTLYTLYLNNSDRTRASNSLAANWNRTCLSIGCLTTAHYDRLLSCTL